MSCFNIVILNLLEWFNAMKVPECPLDAGTFEVRR